MPVGTLMGQGGGAGRTWRAAGPARGWVCGHVLPNFVIDSEVHDFDIRRTVTVLEYHAGDFDSIEATKF